MSRQYLEADMTAMLGLSHVEDSGVTERSRIPADE